MSAASAWCATPPTSATFVVGSQNGVPTRIRDIGEVTIGNAPRLGEFGFNKTDDAVEGVIMMRRGEQTQNVLKGVEAKTHELNEHILPPDIKVRPYYDRSDLVATHHRHGRTQHAAWDGPGSARPDGLSGQHSRRRDRGAHHSRCRCSFRSSFLHARGIPANLLSIGAIDFGILIDGTLVMVENIFRELGAREGQNYDLKK